VQDLAENMGLIELNNRLQDPKCAPWFTGIFPVDTPRNMRFAINFFTSIGLGGLTDAMREHLKNLPKLIMEQRMVGGTQLVLKARVCN
jgi:pre-mRNA-splicing factor CWC22